MEKYNKELIMDYIKSSVQVRTDGRRKKERKQVVDVPALDG